MLFVCAWLAEFAEEVGSVYPHSSPFLIEIPPKKDILTVKRSGIMLVPRTSGSLFTKSGERNFG
jgi:hypothetical protein